MKRLIIGASLLALVTGTALMADRGQNRQHNRQHERGAWHNQNGHWDNGHHRGWAKNRGKNHPWARGERMGYDDWRNAPRVNYREYRLSRPQQGYEWRRSHDRFVLARASNGYVFAVVKNGRR